jgi:hypothetical protein
MAKPLKNQGNTTIRYYKSLYKNWGILLNLDAPKHWYENDLEDDELEEIYDAFKKG